MPRIGERHKSGVAMHACADRTQLCQLWRRTTLGNHSHLIRNPIPRMFSQFLTRTPQTQNKRATRLIESMRPHCNRRASLDEPLTPHLHTQGCNSGESTHFRRFGCTAASTTRRTSRRSALPHSHLALPLWFAHMMGSTSRRASRQNPARHAAWVTHVPQQLWC